MQLTTIGGYDKIVIDEFNKISEKFDTYGLLEEILTRWADDEDIQSITEHLKDRLAENK